ncbi:MAG: hypothetical protein QM731_11390 [Chitinophagaceae bacterium]
MKTTITGGGKQHTLHHINGKVMQSGKNMETIVSGGGGGGYSYKGTGGSAPVSISSRTVVHDQLFLVDETGKEHAFQLQDFNVAAREGNDLTVIWAIKQGKDSGPYIVVHNKTVGQTFYNDSSLNKVFFYPIWYPLLATLLIFWLGGSVFSSMSFTFLLLIGIWVAWFYMGKTEVKKFKQQTDFNSF